MMPLIRDTGIVYDISEALAQIAANPQFWNAYTLRTDRYGTPHSGIDDIWFRFNAWENFHGDPWNFTMLEHESEWYEAAYAMPAVQELVRKVMMDVGATRLGGVLMTRIPPGGSVLPHKDSGWHAQEYEKFAVQMMGNKDQAFHFEDISLSAKPGEMYTFDNSQTHWVTNDSDMDRMTLIICVRRDHES